MQEKRLVFIGQKVYRKLYLEEHTGSVPETIWEDTSNAANASDEIKDIFGKQEFDTPKPTPLIKRILEISTAKSDLILDSFAGSGTTAQAVLDLNKEDGGNRKFILVECEDYANKITAERVRRVIKGVRNGRDEDLKQGLGGSFTYCTLGQELNVETLLKGGPVAGL